MSLWGGHGSGFGNKKLLILLAGLIVIVGLGVAAVMFLLGGNEEVPEI
jgi:flagellar basal body-associated protein FliL